MGFTQKITRIPKIEPQIDEHQRKHSKTANARREKQQKSVRPGTPQFETVTPPSVGGDGTAKTALLRKQGASWQLYSENARMATTVFRWLLGSVPVDSVP